MELLDIINQCLGDDESEPKSDLGMKLFNAAKDCKKKVKETAQDNEPSELELKVWRLRDAEKEGNLAWMNQSSWYRLPVHFRNDFIERIDPFVWSGIYFRYSDFIEHVEVLLNLDDNYSIAVITDAKNYKFVAVTSVAREFDRMPDKEFDRYRKDFRSRLLRVYGIDSKGICCLEVR